VLEAYFSGILELLLASFCFELSVVASERERHALW
jgi:hypothetical protein